MNKYRSRADLQVHVTIPGPIVERTIYIDRDAVVDFDEIVRPARPGREALTLGEALEGRLDSFDPYVPEPVATHDAPVTQAVDDEEVTTHV